MSLSSLAFLLSLSALSWQCRGARAEDPDTLPPSDSPIYISEYQTGEGWVELFNPSSETISLRGFTLVAGGTPQAMSKATIAPGGHYLMSGISEITDGSGFYLKDASGALVDRIDTPQPERYRSIVRTLGKDGAMTEKLEENPTPGFPNDLEGRAAYKASRRRQGPDGIRFSEICPTGKSEFIELYNAASEGIDISGYGLSDKEDYTPFRFPEGTVIGPGEYILVQCGADSTAVIDGVCYAPFAISNGDESIFISDSEGFIIREYGPVSAPKGQSLFAIDGGPLTTGGYPTPGESNLIAGNPPAASLASGQYDGIDTLTVSLQAVGSIRYTTDGSAPDASSALYKAPFRLAKTSVIRAVAIAPDGSKSPIASYTYLINEGHTLDVVSLVGNPAGFFSVGSGIYSTGPYILKPPGSTDEEAPGIDYPYTQANYWRKWIRQANVQFLPKEGAGFSADCGASIFGGFSRINAKKSLKFKFKKPYAAGKLHYKLFEQRDFSEYQSFVMRTGGQDVYGTLIKDDLVSSLADGLLDAMATRPAVFYINGSYYGIYFIREKINKHFIAAHYNVPKDSIDIIQGNCHVENGSIREWNALLGYVKSHDMSVDANYQYACGKMDMQSYADWIITEVWCGNRDAGNVRVFKTPHYDNKWHWILYDVDMGLYSPTSDDYLIYLKPTAQKICQTDLIRGLLKNKEFRALFLDRLEYQMHAIWHKDNVNAAIDRFVTQIGGEVARNNKRWQGTYQGWEEKINGLHAFADKRQAFLKKEFGSNPFLKSLLNMTPEELDRCFEP